jgi:hypothetical protein
VSDIARERTAQNERTILDALITREPTGNEWANHPPLAALRALKAERVALQDRVERAEQGQKHHCGEQRRSADRLREALAAVRVEAEWKKTAEARAVAAEARAAELEAALAGLDGTFVWLAEHYPKALREMPTELFRRFRRAEEALAGAPVAEGEK